MDFDPMARSISCKMALKKRFIRLRSMYSGCQGDLSEFCNLYDSCIRALDIMSEVSDAYLWTAFYKQYLRDVGRLQQIAEMFPF